MPRNCRRVRLEAGLKLSLPKLIRDGMIKPNRNLVTSGLMRWTYAYSGEESASMAYRAGFNNEEWGWLHLQSGSLDQTITLCSEPRHFGGRQWYFRCPYTGRKASVLWMPPGAKEFSSRQRWGRQVAYGSQFQTWFDRACDGSRKLRYRLDKRGIYDVVGDILPPKPKWMRWNTYNRICDRIEHYDGLTDERTIMLMGRLLGR
jgi:hypothetical protein